MANELSIRTRFAVGDLVYLIPQRESCDRHGDGDRPWVGQVVAVKIEYRGPTNYAVGYICEFSSPDDTDQFLYDESLLESLDSDD